MTTLFDEADRDEHEEAEERAEAIRLIDQFDSAVPHIDLTNAPEESIYQELGTYLTMTGARNVVHEHLPFRMMAWAARLATIRNRDHPVWHYGVRPYRLVYHTITIAPSGAGKDLVDDALRDILGEDICYEADSGTLEGLRGTAERRDQRTGKKIDAIPGAIERAKHGWLFVPEGKSISDAAVRDNHSMSFLLKFMESGVANWNLAADHGRLESDAGLCLSLQPQILGDSVATIGQGLPRRALIDWYDHQNPATVKKEELSAQTDPQKYRSAKDHINRKLKMFASDTGGFRPTAYDWSNINPVVEQLADAGRLLIPNDYQLIRTIAVAHTILSEPDPERWYLKPFTPVMNENSWALAQNLIWNRNRLIVAAEENAARARRPKQK